MEPLEWLFAAIILYLLWSSGILSNLTNIVSPTPAQAVAAPPAITSTLAPPISVPVVPTIPLSQQPSSGLSSTSTPRQALPLQTVQASATGTTANGNTGSASGSNVLTTPSAGGATAGSHPVVISNGLSNPVHITPLKPAALSARPAAIRGLDNTRF